MQQTGGIVFLKVLNGIQIDAVGKGGTAGTVHHLVADRPGDNGTDILQTVECSSLPILHQFIEQSLLGLIVIPLAVVQQRVTLHVGLGHHVQAVLIAQVVQIVIIGIVRGADSVDVVLFHQLHILLHHLTGNVLTRHRI